MWPGGSRWGCCRCCVSSFFGCSPCAGFPALLGTKIKALLHPAAPAPHPASLRLLPSEEARGGVRRHRQACSYWNSGVRLHLDGRMELGIHVRRQVRSQNLPHVKRAPRNARVGAPTNLGTPAGLLAAGNLPAALLAADDLPTALLAAGGLPAALLAADDRSAALLAADGTCASTLAADDLPAAPPNVPTTAATDPAARSIASKAPQQCLITRTAPATYQL